MLVWIPAAPVRSGTGTSTCFTANSSGRTYWVQNAYDKARSRKSRTTTNPNPAGANSRNTWAAPGGFQRCPPPPIDVPVLVDSGFMFLGLLRSAVFQMLQHVGITVATDEYLMRFHKKAIEPVLPCRY